MEGRNLCFIALLVLGSCLVVESEYLVTSSRVFRTGTTSKLSVSLYNTREKWNITALLKTKNQKYTFAVASEIFSPDAPGILELKVPRSVPVKYGISRNAQLMVQGFSVVQGRKSQFTETQAITVKQETFVLFIQTDKPIYKPGQTIRMRVIGTQPDLKPVTGKIERVSVSNPSGVRMMQWDNVNFINGIASLEMALSKQPVLGKWKIKARVQGKKIDQVVEVAKYVLPKFQVIIEPPPFIATDSKEIIGSICARYTYGQLVTGRLKATISIKRRWFWYYRKRQVKEIQIEKDIKGCVDFTLTNADLGLADLKHQYYGASLQVKAKVTEKATGVSRNATSVQTQIVPYRVKMTFYAGTSRYFKPGLPFHGQLHVTSPDGVPLSGELITIKATSNKGNIFRKEFKVINGIVNFIIQNVKPESTYLSIDARHGSGAIFGRRYGLRDWYSTAGIYCTPWYSKSVSFLALRKLPAPLRVGAKARINFQYTLRVPEHTSEFNYFVMCSGRLAHSGRKTLKFKIDPSVVKPAATTKSTPQPTTEVIPPTPATPEIPGTESGSAATKPPTSNTPALPTTDDDAIAAGAVFQSNPTLRSFTYKPTSPTGNKLYIADGFIKFKVTQSMVPSCRVLVYYVRTDGETVADSMVVDVEDKLENQVSVRFDDDVRKPGQSVSITLTAAPGSRVAVAAVDKSVHLLRSANELTEDKIISAMKSRDVGPTRQYGRKTKCTRSWWGWPPPGPSPLRQQRSILPYYRNSYVDASKAFYDTGLVYFSNLIIESRPCLPRFPYSILRNGGPGGPNGPVALPMISRMVNSPLGESAIPLPVPATALPRKKKKPKKAVRPSVRKDFPETWLWTEENVSNVTGKKVITVEVPDTITSWYASAFAMSGTHGIGVALPSSLTVFQPFFVSFTLPYSVIRGEQVSIITTVFNYMSRCMTIRIRLTKTEQFEFNSDASKTVCVCSNEAKSVQFTITPLELGHIPLTARASDVLPSICSIVSQEAAVGVVDAVTRKLRVEPEGVRREYTYSSFVCPRDTVEGVFMDRMQISLPTKIVDGSVRATVSAIGDLMGPSLSGLDGLLRLPTGCGEQNMVKFAPNIFIMKYLNSTRQITQDIKTKAVGYLRTGYQRELTYKRKDGSYSAYGERDKQGSLWLTAFVLRSFAQARQFIFVDDEEISATTKWIIGKQLDTGCFQKYGRLFNKALKGGVTTPVTLTAFVVISLLEAGLAPSNGVITKAMKCVTAQKDTVTDSYSNAILAYAHTLARHPNRGEFLRRLNAKAIVEAGLKHWEKTESSSKKSGSRFWVPPYFRASSTNIEMTSYALMAIVGDGSDSNSLADVLPIVRWLTQQRNALGGFSSTQDTCVALQALSQYAGYVYGDTTRMRIDVGYSGGEFFHEFRINENNRLVLQRVEIPSRLLPTTIPIDAFGEGCALVQADVSYNIPEIEEEPAFELNVTVRRRSKHNDFIEMTETGEELCQPLEMEICAKWLKEDSSNMAVIEAKLVSGFSADEETLERLTNRYDLGLMRYEIEGNEVVLYFDEIKHVCLTFGIHQTTVVKKTKPAPVTVYDYYDTDLAATTTYNVSEELCLSKQDEGSGTTPPPNNCPVCPDQVDLNSLIPLLCKKKSLIGVRKMKGGGVRILEYYPNIYKLPGVGSKKPDKKLGFIDISIPDYCTCTALNPRSKALIFTESKKTKKQLRKLVLDNTVTVLHRKSLAHSNLRNILSQCSDP